MQRSTDNMMSRHCSYVNCIVHVLLLLRVAGSEKRVRSQVQFSGPYSLGQVSTLACSEGMPVLEEA